MTKKGLTDTARFLTHISPLCTPRRCWLWLACKYESGYGSFQLGRRPGGGKRYTGAHRAAYELFVGPIPPGQQVLHRCDVRACVNPAHLFLGTNDDNVRDREQKGRGNHSHAAKLTPKQVEEIRGRYARGRRWVSGKVTMTYLAKMYGVRPSTIYSILRGISWRGVP
jgi:hypothetical protein